MSGRQAEDWLSKAACNRALVHPKPGRGRSDHVLSVVMGDASYSDIQKRVITIRASVCVDDLSLGEEIQRFLRNR